MKRVAAFVVSLVLVPTLAAGQSRRQAPPPVPPAPPAPPAAPAAPVLAVPYIDSFAIADAVRSAERAAALVDRDAIRETVRTATESARLAQAAVAQADLQHQLADWHVDMSDWNMHLADWDAMQGFQTYSVMDSRSSDSNYTNGLNLMNDRRYDEAIVRFDRVITQKGDRADAAMYYKAECQARLGKPTDAVMTISELRKAYPQSRYLKDANLLEADAKKLGPDQVNDEEIRLLAIQALQNQDPEKALPYLEKVLTNSTNSLRLKTNALMVLASNDQPRAHQMLLGYAKGTTGNPDLQRKAIQYLGSSRNQKTTTQELVDIYNSTPDYDIRISVINAFKSAGAKSPLLSIAGGGLMYSGDGKTVVRTSNNATTVVDPNSGLRSRAISNLTDLVSPQEVWPLYQKEENKDLRLQWVSLFSSLGAVDQLKQIVSTDKDPSVRNRAISALGNIKSDKLGSTLTDLYASGDKDQKNAVISALSNQNNAEGLVAIARKETDKSMQLEIVRRLTGMAKTSKVAMDYLMEIIK